VVACLCPQIPEAKDEIKARLGRSPDRANAVAMALASQEDAASIGGTQLSF
jgi:hypothetical protein